MIRDREAREVDGVAVQIRDHLHDVGIGDFRRVVDALLQSRHLNFGVVSHGEDGGVDGVGIDQGLVALDVHHDVAILGGGDFSGPVGARSMVGTGHPHPGAEFPCDFVYLLVISGN